MTETSGQILKSDKVELEGRYLLELVQEHFETDQPQQTNDASAAPQARIIENHADHAIIEVVCCCGEKVNLRCDYAGAQTPENS